MKNNYLSELNQNHSLFVKCISANAPVGYNEKIKAFIEWLENFNKKNSCNIQIGQIKMKFGYLTIYVQEDMSKNIPVFKKPKKTHLVQTVHEKVAHLSHDVRSICDICSKQLVKSVRNSKIVMVCFEHMNNTTFFKMRKN